MLLLLLLFVAFVFPSSFCAECADGEVCDAERDFDRFDIGLKILRTSILLLFLRFFILMQAFALSLCFNISGAAAAASIAKASPKNISSLMLYLLPVLLTQAISARFDFLCFSATELRPLRGCSCSANSPL